MSDETNNSNSKNDPNSGGEFDALSSEDIIKKQIAEYNAKWEALQGSDADLGSRARETFQQSLPGISKQLVDMAMHSPVERTRLDATKYILDRTLFTKTSTDDEMQEFLNAITGATGENTTAQDFGSGAGSKSSKKKKTPKVIETDNDPED